MTLDERITGEMCRAQQALDRVRAGVEAADDWSEMGDIGSFLESTAAMAQSACQLHAHASAVMALKMAKLDKGS
jgi:hypothetical protein